MSSGNLRLGSGRRRAHPPALALEVKRVRFRPVKQLPDDGLLVQEASVGIMVQEHIDPCTAIGDENGASVGRALSVTRVPIELAASQGDARYCGTLLIERGAAGRLISNQGGLGRCPPTFHLLPMVLVFPTSERNALSRLPAYTYHLG